MKTLTNIAKFTAVRSLLVLKLSSRALAACLRSFTFCICPWFTHGTHFVANRFLMVARLARFTHFLIPIVVVALLVTRRTFLQTNGFPRFVEVLHITAGPSTGFGIVRLVAVQTLWSTFHLATVLSLD